MPLISPQLHRYILPLGFAIIIVLMISTTLLTTTRIEKTSDTIIKNQTEINNMSRVLGIMSSANLERSHSIFNLIQSRNPQKIKAHISELYKQSIIFHKARSEYISYGPSEVEKKLLSKQAVMTIENILWINEAIDYLTIKNYKTATDIVNNEVLPRNKSILGLIEEFHEAADTNAHFKLEEAKAISSDTYRSILSIQILSILMILALMFYLSRKQRKSDRNLSLLASTDTLTDLPNRSSFLKKIDRTILKAKQTDTLFSIIFLDIDYFKSINDIYGHETGDKVLNLFSSTIKKEISDDDVLARFGGDEFVLLLKNTSQQNDFINVIRKLSRALDTSYLIDKNQIFVTASMGASIFPQDGNSSAELLKNADTAMYTAKQSGRNCYQYFSLEDSQKLEHEHMVSHALQTILESDNKDEELSLVYQPLVNFDDNNFNECEALIRWTDKNGENVNTGEFIEIAEKSNLIQKVNMFVIEEACKQQYEWAQQGIHDVRININLSGNKRIFDELFKCLLENLNRYKLSPKLFGIELTERTIYEVSEDTSKSLNHFRKLGMKIAIDDFGTGYSSLSYLKDLPITSLKIDKKFVSGLPHDKVDGALVNTIITLAHSLDLDVVAEGIETQEQFDFLKNCQCNIAQGYLLHRPMNSKGISHLKLVA